MSDMAILVMYFSREFKNSIVIARINGNEESLNISVFWNCRLFPISFFCNGFAGKMMKNSKVSKNPYISWSSVPKSVAEFRLTVCTLQFARHLAKWVQNFKEKRNLRNEVAKFSPAGPKASLHLGNYCTIIRTLWCFF